MIEFTKAYKVGDKTFASLKEAQINEIKGIFVGLSNDSEAASVVVENADKIINILSTGPNSRPKARKANGAVRAPRKNKPQPHVDPQADLCKT